MAALLGRSRRCRADRWGQRGTEPRGCIHTVSWLSILTAGTRVLRAGLCGRCRVINAPAAARARGVAEGSPAAPDRWCGARSWVLHPQGAHLPAASRLRLPARGAGSPGRCWGQGDRAGMWLLQRLGGFAACGPVQDHSFQDDIKERNSPPIKRW